MKKTPSLSPAVNPHHRFFDREEKPYWVPGLKRATQVKKPPVTIMTCWEELSEEIPLHIQFPSLNGGD